jgi:hypothetical protein
MPPFLPHPGCHGAPFDLTVICFPQHTQERTSFGNLDFFGDFFMISSYIVWNAGCTPRFEVEVHRNPMRRQHFAASLHSYAAVGVERRSSISTRWLHTAQSAFFDFTVFLISFMISV